MADSDDGEMMSTPTGIEDFIELERQRQFKLKERSDKYERNAELINILDRDFKMLPAYPRDDHPTVIDFYSNKNPQRYAKFIGLMKRYKKTQWVTLESTDTWHIWIDDKEEEE